MTQLELTIKAHVSPAMVVAIENYNYKPSPEVRAKIANALHTSPESIWPETEKVTVNS